MYCEHEHAECYHDRDFFRGDIRFQEQLHDLNCILGTGEKHHPCHKEHSQRYCGILPEVLVTCSYQIELEDYIDCDSSFDFDKRFPFEAFRV